MASHIKSAIYPNRAAAATARPRKVQGAKAMQVKKTCIVFLLFWVLFKMFCCVLLCGYGQGNDLQHLFFTSITE